MPKSKELKAELDVGDELVLSDDGLEVHVVKWQEGWKLFAKNKYGDVVMEQWVDK